MRTLSWFYMFWRSCVCFVFSVPVSLLLVGALKHYTEMVSKKTESPRKADTRIAGVYILEQLRSQGLSFPREGEMADPGNKFDP